MAGLSAFLALVVGGTLWLVLAENEYVAPTPTTPSAQIEPAEAAGVLQELVQAVRTGDQETAAALAPEGDRAAADQLRALARNADAIGLSDLTLRYVDELGGIGPEGEWSATATLGWRFAVDDTEPASTEVRVDFADEEDGVAVSGLGGEGGATPIWFAERVAVRRTSDTVVVASRQVDRYAALAREAVVVVRRVLPGWKGPLVVEVPSSAVGVDAALGADRGTFRNVAGVTATVDGSGSSRAPVHVFLNPARMRELRPAGAQVVVSHEAAHVALDATGSSLPVWLSEGFADYVALRDVPLPLTTTGAQIIRQVRREGPPEALPDDRDFDDESEYFGAAYEASWFACRLLALRGGEETLLGFYRAADGADDLAQVFRRTYGIGLGAFTREWRTALSDLAG